MVSEGGYVEKGSVVSVVRVEGARVVVRQARTRKVSAEMDFTATLGLLFVGFILLVLEVLVIPGIGLAGVAGFGILAWACFEIWTAQGPLIGLLSIGATALTSGWTLWSLARSSWGRKMILDSALDSEDTGSTIYSGFSDVRDLQRARFGRAESS